MILLYNLRLYIHAGWIYLYLAASSHFVTMWHNADCNKVGRLNISF